MKILIKSATPGLLGGYVASIENAPSGASNHMGNTMGEAVGKLVMANAQVLGIETEFVPSGNKTSAKKRLNR